MNSLLKRKGIGSSVSMLLHEHTKNYPGVREFISDSPVPPAGTWADTAFALEADAAPIDLADWLQAPVEISAEQVLARRYSSRNFAPRGLTLAELAAFWATAYPAQVREPGYQALARPHQTPQAWNGHVTLVRPIVIVQAVEGLAPGAYRLDETRMSLHRLAVDHGQAQHLLETACFQSEFRGAALLCLMVGSISDALQRYGERGYRYMLLENGVQLQRQSMACAGLDLAGCITGSFVQGAWDRWLGLDGFEAGALNAYALGHRPSARPGVPA